MNLILTACANYPWPQVEPFFVSLRRHVPHCRCVCFVWNINAETRSKLSEQEIELIDMRIGTRCRGLLNRWRHMTKINPARFLPGAAGRLVARHAAPLGSLRFFYYLDYLKSTNAESSKILLTDIRDVVFQDNPFSWVCNEGVQFYMEDPDSSRIGYSGDVNRVWLDSIYGKKRSLFLEGAVVSCAGTISGATRDVIVFLETFVTELTKLSYLPHGATDQAVHNMILYSAAGKFIRIPVENGKGAVLTVLNTRPGAYSVDAEDRVMDMRGRVIPILHTYDRFPDLVRAQRRRLGLEIKNAEHSSQRTGGISR